jgi:hypothetical protein
VPEFLDPEIALVTAGVETDVLGIGRGALCPEAIEAVTAAHPRPDFKRQILQAFTAGMSHRSFSTFGTVNADVLQHFDDEFVRDLDVTKLSNSVTRSCFRQSSTVSRPRLSVLDCRIQRARCPGVLLHTRLALHLATGPARLLCNMFRAFA